ncbi:MAG: AMP-binding protein [Saccharofermentanales bacterium]
MTKNVYKYPLEEVREITDLRDMLRQSEALYGSRTAYLTKDPIAAREIAPRSQEAAELRIDHKRPYKPVTYGQFAKDVRDLGTGLMKLGVTAQSRVAIYAETRYEWYVTYLAVVSGLAVVVPLDKEQPANEVVNLVTSSEADVLLFSKGKKDVVDSIRDQIPGVRHYIGFDLPEQGESDLYFWDILKEGAEAYQAGDRAYDDLPIDPEAMQILLFTSGTTSNPKAVMLSHKNICKNLMGMCSMTYIGPDDVFLSVLPIHHTYECTCGYLCPLYRGCSVAICEGLRYIVPNMQEAKPSIVLVVPLMMEAFHRGIMKKVKGDPELAKKFKLGLKLTKGLRKVGIDLRRKIFSSVHENFGGNIRLLIAGGAAIAPELMSDMQDLGFGCIQGYGLTECAPILALNRTHYFNNRSAGLALPGVDIKILDPDENGIGEIAGRGDNVMLGYYKNEAATREVIDEDGWFHTGDYGYLDPKQFVIITGRKANLIVTKNGKNVFPEEIEFLLTQHPLIAEAVVSGKERKDGDSIIHAEIFPDREAVDEDPDLKGLALTDDKVKEKIDQVVKEVNSGLVAYKTVRSTSLRDSEFPKTTAKKIIRH